MQVQHTKHHQNFPVIAKIASNLFAKAAAMPKREDKKDD